MKIDNLDEEKKLPTRIDKTLAWLAGSRDKWKDKCMETKLRLKIYKTLLSNKHSFFGDAMEAISFNAFS
jgi:hypothetical protein